MVDWIPGWVLIPVGILFIGVYGSGLYLLLKEVLKKIPVWVPPLLAMLTIAVYAVLAPDGPAPEYFVIPMLLLMLTFVIMPVLQAFSFFEDKDLGVQPWIAVVLLSYVAVFLLGIFFLGGSVESRIGGPGPGFSYRFPVLGLVIDSIITILNLSSIAYFSPGYSIILFIGLYLEIFLCSGVIFFVMSVSRKKSG
ncbi:MAG: hypothetical protein WC626_13600 [Methanoregula sp.]